MVKEGTSAFGSVGRHRVHGSVVVIELAFALVLLTGAGLMLKGLWVIRSRTVAFAPDHVLTTSLNVRDSPFTINREQYLGDLATQLEAILGVHAAAVINFAGGPLRILGMPVPPPDRETMLSIVRVTLHFPAAAGVHLLSGRWLGDKDREGAPHVMVVNEAFVKWYQTAYPGSGSILGRRLDEGSPPFTIVGVISFGHWSGGTSGRRCHTQSIRDALAVVVQRFGYDTDANVV